MGTDKALASYLHGASDVPSMGLTVGGLLDGGYRVMPKYRNNPEKTAEAIDQARRITSGDTAVVDDEG